MRRERTAEGYGPPIPWDTGKVMMLVVVAHLGVSSHPSGANIPPAPSRRTTRASAHCGIKSNQITFDNKGHPPPSPNNKDPSPSSEELCHLGANNPRLEFVTRLFGTVLAAVLAPVSSDEPLLSRCTTPTSATAPGQELGSAHTPPYEAGCFPVQGPPNVVSKAVEKPII